MPAAASRERTGHTCSSGTQRPSRLVARIRTVAEWASMASIRSAAASRTCSQLSITNNRTLPSWAAAIDSLTVLPGCWVMPSTAATASGTAAGSDTAASSKTQTPSGNSSTRRAATAAASRVLPTPPTPVNVTNRCALTAAWTSSSSHSRPIKLVGAGPQIPRTRIQRPQRRKVCAQALCLNLEHLNRSREIPQPPRSQIDEINAAEQTRRRLGQQDLTTMSGGHHACSTIEHRSEVIPITQLGLAGCQSPWPRRLLLQWRVDRGVHGRARQSEGRQQTIFYVEEHGPVL